jgi:hypothetical protein
MKRIQNTIIICIALALAGCTDTLSSPADAPAAKTGRVILGIAGTGERTILPQQAETPQFSKYVFSFEPKGSQQQTPDPVPVNVTGGQQDVTGVVDLEPGPWTITAKGYVNISGVTGVPDGDYLAAEGSGDINVAGGQTNTVTIDLNAGVLAGEGVLEWDITVPSGAAATMELLDLDGDAITKYPAIDVSGANSSGSMLVDAGYYFLVLSLGDDVQKYEVLRIYSGMPSRVEHALKRHAQKPVISTQPAPTTTWSGGSPASISLTVAASVTDGGTLSYQWYSNTSDTNTGGYPISGATSGTLTLNSSAYTLNGSYYFYAVATNTNNAVNGTRTAAITSNAAAVTVTGGATATEITTSQQMANISTGLSGNYRLMNDITLENWTPIGDATTSFTGTFDGNGHKITLASFASTALTGTADLGIFGYVQSSSAAVKNLAIHSEVNATSTSAQDQYIGLLAGRVSLAVIENITLTGTFGFVSDRTIQIGGAAGNITGAGTLVKNITSSLNMNIIPGSSGAASSYTYAGGIVGIFQSGAGIENCHNTGDVIADNVQSAITTAGQVFVGGITGGGAYAMSTAYHGYIKDSSFAGTVIGRAKGNWTFAGGIAGTIVGGTVNDIEATTRIERCSVTGTVSEAGTSSAYPYLGGVVGYNYQGALVSQSYFAGVAIGGPVSNSYAGGIVGYNSQAPAPNNTRIEDCWSSGTVTGQGNFTGGIVGQNIANAIVKNCYSTTAVYGGGGIGGANSGDAITACVALNPLLNNANRISGGNNMSNNYAWSGMFITTGASPAKGLTATGGEDLATQTPPQSFYVDTLNWDFTDVWKMGTAGFPLLKWQDETPISRSDGTVNTINVTVPALTIPNNGNFTITSSFRATAAYPGTSFKKGTSSQIRFQASVANAGYVWYAGTERKPSVGTQITNARQCDILVDDLETGPNIITAVLTLNGIPYSNSIVVIIEGE